MRPDSKHITDWTLGIRRLYLHPDYGVTRGEFDTFVRCMKAINHVEPPALHNVLSVAVSVAEKFGGCSLLDQYQRRLDAFYALSERIRVAPTIPVEDVDHVYQWKMLGPIGNDPQEFAAKLEGLQNQGYEFACFVGPSHTPNHYLSLRRPRRKTNQGRDGRNEQS